MTVSCTVSLLSLVSLLYFSLRRKKGLFSGYMLWAVGLFGGLVLALWNFFGSKNLASCNRTSLSLKYT